MSEKEQRQIFQKNLLSLLNKNIYSQNEVAEYIGVSPQTFNTWCRGIAIPRMSKMQKLADFFGVKKSSLFDEQANDKSTNFAERFKALRIENNLTQKDISDDLGISKSAIGMYENGNREPNFDLLCKISDYFNVDIDYLLGKSNKVDIRTERLRNLVYNSGMSQTEICQKTGINKGALSSYISGRYFPKPKALEKLANLFNVNIDYLMGLNNENQESVFVELADMNKELAEIHKLLFAKTKNATLNDMKKIIIIVDTLLGENNGD